MSGTNASPVLPEITLDELERLIRILGMLGSAADGEVLAAAKFAQKWVVEHGTDWRTLLTPPEEALPVTGVGAPVDVDALMQAQEIERVEAYQRGFQAGVRDAMARAHAKAQQAAAMAAAQQRPGVIQQGIGGHPAAQASPGASPGAGSAWVGWNINAQAFAKTHPAQNVPPGGLGGGLGGAGAQAPPRQGLHGQPVQPAPGAAGGPGGFPAGVMRSWQDACKELLDRQGQGIPGVFRKPAEQTFVTDVLARGFPTLTPAQDKWLRDIAGRNGLSW